MWSQLFEKVCSCPSKEQNAMDALEAHMCNSAIMNIEPFHWQSNM